MDKSIHNCLAGPLQYDLHKVILEYDSLFIGWHFEKF